MKHAEWNDFLADFLSEMQEIMTTKGHDYCRGMAADDKLANMKAVAAMVGVPPRVVWAVYVAKHWCAIMTAVATGELESEPIRSRFLDLANYAALGAALFAEQ